MPTSGPDGSTVVRAIGLMSGTSLDGVDAVLMHTDGASYIKVEAHHYLPFAAEFAQQLGVLAQDDIPLVEVLRLEQALTQAYATAVAELRQQSPEPVAVIGMHGQTIRHLPDEGLTWQLGNPSLLAERTAIPVVSDFRRRDMAAGGQGAPLAALYHQALLAEQEKPCVVLNLGGVANITALDADGQVVAADVGPGCGLLDVWVQQHQAGRYDEEGRLAASGKPDRQWAARQLAEHPFFGKALPKSADRYDFDALQPTGMTLADGAASLCALTAAGVASGIRQLPVAPKHIWVTGGGRQHPVILAELRNLLDGLQLIDDLGTNGDMLEAACFAWLAVRRLRGLALSEPATTGAAHPTCGGVLTA